MSARKRWKVRLLPLGGAVIFQSKAAAYREIAEWRKASEPGGIAWSGDTVKGVRVLVDERDGRGFQLYERVDF